VLLGLFLTGGAGGLVRAIVEDTRTENALTLPFSRKTVALGWFGDALIGGCASIVGYTFFNVLGTTTPSTTMPDIVKLAGFGIASGYAGARILNAMLDRFPERKLNLLAAKQDALRLHESGKYLFAARRFREILSQDPTDLQSKANLALSLSYTGEDGIKEALTLLDEVVRTDPKNAEAWYNIACMRAVATFKNFSHDEVLQPLKKAIDLDADWKQYLATDKDFNRFRVSPSIDPYVSLTGDKSTSPIT
jgi:hypothetical protein